MDVTCNNQTFHVLQKGAGIPLLFVHGFPLDHSMWSHQIEKFSETHRVIAPDLRGFGNSQDSSESVSMEQFADDLAAILDELAITEPVIFCGLSMGGYIAFQFAKKYPHRLRQLILMDTRAQADDETTARARRQMANTVVAEGLSAVPGAMLPKLLSESSRQKQPELEAELSNMILKQKPAAVAAAQRGMAARPSSEELLGQINVPTLVICGQHDQISTVEEMQGITHKIPLAQFVEIPDAGHMTPMEAPELVSSKIANFIDTNQEA